MRNVMQVLLVVLILLLGGGMFLICVVQVRAAAARAQCSNNLHQLMIAVLNYADTFSGRFPPAAEPSPDLVPEKRLSWAVEIWPYVEGSPIYNKMDHKKCWEAEENRFAALTRLRIFQCPSYPEQTPVSTLEPTHYLGIAGIGTDAINLPASDSRAGFFGYDRRLTVKDVEGRAGSLLVLAETSQASGTWIAAGPPTTRGLEPNGAPYLGTGGQFGGNHRLLINVAFADGSVRFLEQSIDPKVWEAMATVSGKGNQE